jgi:hypothetical protein
MYLLIIQLTQITGTKNLSILIHKWVSPGETLSQTLHCSLVLFILIHDIKKKLICISGRAIKQYS